MASTPAKTISSAALTALGDSGPGRRTTKVVHFISSSFVGTITIKGRLTGTTRTAVAIPYKKRYLNGLAADDSIVSTGITSDSIIEVNASGLDIFADTTAAYTSGSMAVETVDLTD